jgi:proteic killer suppression protein
MIVSFEDDATEKIFHREYSRKLPFEIQRQAYKKLLMLHAACSLNDLRVPPANRLKKLKGKQAHLYSIRINNQWRITFQWIHRHAYNVLITDYH